MKELKTDIQTPIVKEGKLRPEALSDLAMVRQIIATETEKFQESTLKNLLEKRGIFN